MKKEYTLEELLHKAASYCSISEHCVLEVEDKLTAWGVADEDKKKNYRQIKIGRFYQ